MRNLTSRQQEVLDCILVQMKEMGRPPTRAEIARKMGFKSINAAEQHLKALAKKNVIELVPGASRGITLLGDYAQDIVDSSQLGGLPIIGRVAAGEPIFSEEHIEGHWQLESNTFRPKADYLLRVEGESMREIGIMNGDLLAVHKTQDVTQNQIVVARVDDGDVTVKRFRREDNKIYLYPENSSPEYQPIEVGPDRNISIEGLGVGVIRPDLTAFSR
ncbi:MAG: transcriptional repressor LexA [Pseudomonadota bacterium]